MKISSKNDIKEAIKSVYWLFFRTSFTQKTGLKKKYPTVIQLPITYRCNAKCVMCNIPNMDHSNEISPEELRNIMSDPIFKKVKAVGINGGEPFLKKDIEEFVAAVLTLPSITSFNIISNSFLTKRILEKLEAIYNLCKERGVKFHFSSSLDGVGKVHDTVRGIPGASIKTMNTILEVHTNMHKYCDSFDVGCTVSKYNVNSLVELDTLGKKHGLDIKYRIAISNKRIDSVSNYDIFNILDNKEDRQAATEFFFGRYNESRKIKEKYKYWSIFRYLADENPTRFLGCDWQQNGVTLDSKGMMFYCAVESEPIGNVREERVGEEVFFDDQNLQYRQQILRDSCEGCIHDYNGDAQFSNKINFIKDVLHDQLWAKNYN